MHVYSFKVALRVTTLDYDVEIALKFFVLLNISRFLGKNPNQNTRSPFIPCSAKDEEAGEIPVAFVVLKEGSSVSDAALMNYVAKQVIILAALIISNQILDNSIALSVLTI